MSPKTATHPETAVNLLFALLVSALLSPFRSMMCVSNVQKRCRNGQCTFWPQKLQTKVGPHLGLCGSKSDAKGP